MIHNLDACIVCCFLDPLYLKPRRCCTANRAKMNFPLLPSSYREDKNDPLKLSRMTAKDKIF